MKLRRALNNLTLIPRRFLFFLPLHVGAEVITAFAVLNHASALYGLLSIFTGHHLSVMEWILNLITLVTLPVYAYVFAHSLPDEDGLQILLYTYMYFVDSAVSIGLSIFFCVNWFTKRSKRVTGSLEGSKGDEIGGDAGDNVVSKVLTAAADAAARAVATVTATAAAATATGPSPATGTATAAGSTGTATNAPDLSSQSASLARETSVTIIITVVLMLVRIYFAFVLLGYARRLVRQQNLRRHNGAQGWRSRAQYVALSVFETFWTGTPYYKSESEALSADYD